MSSELAKEKPDMTQKPELKIGAAIHAWRDKRGMMQKQLALTAGMDPTQLWSLENDRYSPSVRTLGRIADALGVTAAELLSLPHDGDSRPRSAASSPDFRALTIDETELVPILKSGCETRAPSSAIFRALTKIAASAFEEERKRQTDGPTGLPLATPVKTTESGAEQIAHILRAYLDIGTAVVQDVRLLFECQGVRIVEKAVLPDKIEAMTFYAPKQRYFTVFLSKSLAKKPWRRDFMLLSEIGRMFLFSTHGFAPYKDSKRSSRFAHHFAATFLQPAAAVRNAVYSLRVEPDEWTYELLLRLKTRFGVSAQAFNIRLWELGLISGKLHKKFEKRIKAYYRNTGNDEPQQTGGMPANRLGDLIALGMRA